MVGRALASEYCRGIITWTGVAKKSILLNYDCAGFEDKIKVIPPAFCSKNYNRDYDRGRVRLLFVGSPDDPEDFVMKGGREVLAVFYKLLAKYKDIELVIRANVPDEIKKSIPPASNIKVIGDRLPQGAMAKLFEDADIYFHPSYKLQNTSILEAMSYGLPVVTTDIGSSCGEYVVEGSTGFIVKNPRKVPFFIDNYILTSETIHRGRLVTDVDRRVVNDLVERVGALVESPLMREMMGKAGKWEIDYGRFSIRRRNLLLKKVFDGAV